MFASKSMDLPLSASGFCTDMQPAGGLGSCVLLYAWAGGLLTKLYVHAHAPMRSSPRVPTRSGSSGARGHLFGEDEGMRQ